MSRISIVLKRKENLEGSILITGFQGIGAVGYIATKHLIKELGAERIGFILSRFMSDVVLFENGKVILPYEVYYTSRKGLKLVFILNNAQPLVHERALYARKIIEWCIENSFSRGIFIGGLDKTTKRPHERSEFKCLPSSSYNFKIPGPTLSKELVVVGPLALLIAFSEIYDFPSLTILPYSETLRPDPAAAAVAVRTVGNMLGLKVNVDKLYEDARTLEQHLKRFEEFQKFLERRIQGRISHYM